jgi:PAS domain S-box-containing protein
MNPIQVMDCDGVTRYANPAFLKWSGMDDSSVIGQNLFNRMNISNQERHSVNLWELAKPDLNGGKPWSVEVEFIRSDGRKVSSNLILSPVLNATGKLTECIALHSDLMERREFERKIFETQRQYQSIVESSLDGIMVIQEGQIEYINPAAINIFGYSSTEEMKKVNFNDIIAPPNKPSIFLEYTGRNIGERLVHNYEMRGLSQKGKIIDLEANANVIEWNNRPAVQVSFRDITERKMLEREQALWLWEQWTLSEIDRKLVGVVNLEQLFLAILQHTLNLTHAGFGGVLLFDEASTQAQWKAIQGNILEYSTEMFDVTEKLQFILKADKPFVINDSIGEVNYSLSLLPIVGKEKLISTACFPLIVEGKSKGILVVGYRQSHDFEGREIRLLTSLAEKHSIAMVNAQLYGDLLQRGKELEIISGARVRAQEEERKRIAREIHDGLGQMLTAIKFNLEILEDMINAGAEERERIADMKNLLDSVMKEARELSYNLMPSVLDDFGLVPALQLLSEQFMNRTNIQIIFQTHGISERLDPQLEIGLYRIAQESLNNIAKHAEASEVNIQVIYHTEGIRLVVEDNGKGFIDQPKRKRATGKGGMGLINMRERATTLGGMFTIDSARDKGTLITVEIPLMRQTSNE